jgi:rare lipoprotein A
MNRFILTLRLILLAVALHALAGCGTTPHITPPPSGRKQPAKATQRPYVIRGKTYYPIPNAEGYRETGIASWYGKPFHGRKTSNGETYDMHAPTAAHKTLPMGTMLLVKNLENGRTTVVRINDRGPFVQDRIIDLSYKAAKDIDMIRKGTAKVSITALGEALAQGAPPEAHLKKGVLASKKKTPALKHADFDRGRFYIQVGSFEKHAQARKLARKFAARGRDVIIQEFPAAGTHLYRVMIFSSTSLKKARAEKRYLGQHGFPYALVIAR